MQLHTRSMTVGVCDKMSLRMCVQGCKFKNFFYAEMQLPQCSDSQMCVSALLTTMSDNVAPRPPKTCSSWLQDGRCEFASSCGKSNSSRASTAAATIMRKLSALHAVAHSLHDGQGLLQDVSAHVRAGL